MSSITDPQPDPTADEIVAYLDGELAPQDCRRVENRLATDDEYRQELHELDRAWDALDALPAPTVDDGFARTTIELACVAAEGDLTDRTSAAKVANRNRMWRWIAAGTAASVFGFMAGRALIPDHNAALLADLSAIHQLNVLPYVENVDFLRRLSVAIPPDQFIKDTSAVDRKLQELQSANSPDMETRRHWVQSLPPERKAELADRTRTFVDLGQGSEEREHMRKLMEDIRKENDSANLEKTLVAYGLWLSRHTAGEQELILEQLDRLHGSPTDQQVEVVQKHVEQDERLASRHLKPADAEKLRQEIAKISQEHRDEIFERARKNRKGMRNNAAGSIAPQATLFALADLFRGDKDKRDEIAARLIGQLSETERAHWQTLDRPRKWGQLLIWIKDAMQLKADSEKLEEFFASDKLNPKQRQELLDKPYANMEADLERMYFKSELGIDNPGQLFGDFSEPGRKPWTGPGMGPREGAGPNRPPGHNPDRGPRPDGPPGERRPRNRPPRSPGDPAGPEQKQAI